MAKDNSLPTEDELRERVEKRVKKRAEEFQGLLWHLGAYLFVNLIIFGLGGWLTDVLRGDFHSPPGTIWIAFFWGIGMVAHLLDYWYEHGPGYERRERLIDREVEKERQRLYGVGYQDKAKNDERYGLSDDGELVDLYDEGEKHKRR